MSNEHRKPGQAYIELAHKHVVVLSANDPQLVKDRSRTVLSHLTPLDKLDQQFPVRLSGTPYCYFASLTEISDTEQVIVTVDYPGEELPSQLAEPAYNEAALGMYDNMLFH